MEPQGLAEQMNLQSGAALGRQQTPDELGQIVMMLKEGAIPEDLIAQGIPEELVAQAMEIIQGEVLRTNEEDEPSLAQMLRKGQ